MNCSRACVSLLVTVLLISAALALTADPVTPAAPSPSPRPCHEPEFRAFDFWLGKWRVLNAKGDVVGTNEITQAAGECAIREQWSGAKGMRGISINYFDASDRQWHQHWVGSDGVVLDLKGNLQEGAMTMSDLETTKEKAANRIVWTPLPGGKLKQEWSISKDRGQTWQPIFVGFYEKE